MNTSNDLELAEYILQLKEKYGKLWAFKCTTDELNELKSIKNKVTNDEVRSK